MFLFFKLIFQTSFNPEESKNIAWLYLKLNIYIQIQLIKAVIHDHKLNALFTIVESHVLFSGKIRETP